jgi:hypothetical protein
MAAKLKFKSDLLESIHTSARGLHEIGALDKVTMRHFDESCLSTPPSLAPEQINQFANRIASASQFLPTTSTPAHRQSRNGRLVRSSLAAWLSNFWQ